MAKRNVHLVSLVGPGVALKNQFVDVRPGYRFTDAGAVNWPDPITYQFENGELTVYGLEDTFEDLDVVWVFQFRNLDSRNQPIGPARIEQVDFVGTTGTTVEYTDMRQVEEFIPPEYMPTVYAQTVEARDEAIAAQIAAEQAAAEASSLSGMTTLITAYGSVGDGVADDSAAFAAALAATPNYGILWLPKGTYKFATPVTHTRTNVSISGPGRINGKLVVGAFGANYDFQGQSISGLQFTRGGASTDPTVACIELRNVLNLRIEDCSFRDAGSAIYNLTEIDTARNTIQNNFYNNVGYFIRSVRGGSAVFRAIADIHVLNNSGQTTVSAVDIDSIDGLVCTGNTFFSSGYQNASGIKQYNIRLGYSDFVVISNNQLFESGLESIKLTDPNRFTIEGNNIAWPGQRVPSDAISITLVDRPFTTGSIGGGTISQPTKNFIGLYGSGSKDYSKVVVAPFATERDSGGSPYYYGAATLPTVSRRLYVDGPVVTAMPALPPYQGAMLGTVYDDFHGRGIATERWVNPYNKESSLQPRSLTVNPSQLIYQIADINGGLDYFSGLVTLDVRNEGTVAMTAIYHLLVLKSPDSATASCIEIAKTGKTTGGAANHPSFTWDVFKHTDNKYYLRATRINLTAGSFHFAIVASGNIKLDS